MKKSSTYAIIVSCYKKWISPISFFTILVLLFSGKTQGQSSDPFSLQNQTIFKIFQNSQTYLNPQTTNVNHESNTLQWENIQSFVVDQPVGPAIFPKPVTINLDQVRNGSADSRNEPPDWVNGNAGSSNAHYVEGYSIAYRLVIENLVGNGLRSVDIEWDTRHGGANALDFITNFDLIDFPAGSHVFNFAHPQETINPLYPEGFIVTEGTSPNIPQPANLVANAVTTFNAIQSANRGKFGIWNASITPVTGVTTTGLRYITQNPLTGAQSSTRLRIYFTNTAPTVIISWGGHIAKGADWGVGNSASAVSGSPYHTRTIEWDPDGDDASPESLGNQDRSLSADAVLDPPKCNLTGPSSLECSATSTFFSGVSSSDITSGVSFEWAIVDNNTNATTCAGYTSKVDYLCVNAGSGCNTFTVRYRLLKTQGGTTNEISRCVKLVTITDVVPPVISGVGGPSSIDCPASPTFSSPTASDACGTASVSLTFNDQSTTSCGNARSITRKWTATDACNNTTTASQTITVRDNTPPVISGVGGPSTIDCPASPTFSSPTASDACSGSSVTLVPSDQTVTSCGNARSVTRTWLATDACGNTATRSQTITIRDNTPPVISGVGGPSTIDCPASPTFSTPTASDACTATTVAIGFTDQTTNSCGNARSVTRTWLATDACGNTATASQTITVRDNTPPVISGVGGPLTIDCPASPTFSTPTASDACSGTTVAIVPSDQTTNSCGSTRTVTRKWTATDACGNTATASQTITVRDITPPTLTCPPDITVDCNGATGSATATDACDPSVTVTFNDQASNSTSCVRSITRKWTATDDCGNTATCVQHIIVRDRVGPVVTCTSPTTATASDACSGVIDLYLTNGVWTAIDGAGNITTANASTCVQSSSRMATSQVTEENQPQQTVTEEKTVVPIGKKALVKDITVQAIPNPFNDRVRFVVSVPQSGYATLEVMNMLGQKVKTVFQGRISAGGQSFEMVLPESRNTTLFYILRMNGKQVTGKLVQMN